MDIQWHVVGELDAQRREWAEARIRKLAEGQKDLIHVVVHVESSNHHQHGAAEAKSRSQARGREVIAHEREVEPEIALGRAVEVSREGAPVLVNARIGRTSFRKGSISI